MVVQWTFAEVSGDAAGSVTIVDGTVKICDRPTDLPHASNTAYMDRSITETINGWSFVVHKAGEHGVEMMQACAEEYWIRYLLERKAANDRVQEERLTCVVVFKGTAFAFTHLGISDASTVQQCVASISSLLKGVHDVQIDIGSFSKIGDNFSHARGVHQGTEVFALRLPRKFRGASKQTLSLLASAISLEVDPSSFCILNAIFSPQPHAPPGFSKWSLPPLETSVETIKRLGGGANLYSMIKSLRGGSTDFHTYVIHQDVKSQNLAHLLLQLACEGHYPLPDLKATITGTHTATAPEKEALLKRVLKLAFCDGERDRDFECVNFVPTLRDRRQVWNSKRNAAVVTALKENEEFDALKLLKFTNALMAVGKSLASVPRVQMESKLDRTMSTWKKRVAISMGASSNGGGGGGGGGGSAADGSRRKSSRQTTKGKSATTSKAAAAAAAARAQLLDAQRIPAEDWDLDSDRSKKTLLAYFKLYDCDHLFELQRARRSILIAQIRITRLEHHGLCKQALQDFIAWLNSPANLRLLGCLMNKVKGRAESKRLVKIFRLAAEIDAAAAIGEPASKRPKLDDEIAPTAISVTLPAAAVDTTYMCADGTNGADVFRTWLTGPKGIELVTNVVAAEAACVAFLKRLLLEPGTKPTVYRTTVQYLIQAVESMLRFTEQPCTALVSPAHTAAAAVMNEVPLEDGEDPEHEVVDSGESDDSGEDNEDVDSGESDDGGEHDAPPRALSTAWRKARRSLKKKHAKALLVMCKLEAAIETADPGLQFNLGTARDHKRPSWWKRQKCCVQQCKFQKLISRFECNIDNVRGYSMCLKCAHVHKARDEVSASFRWEKWVKCKETARCELCTTQAEEGPAQEQSSGGGAAAAGN